MSLKGDFQKGTGTYVVKELTSDVVSGTLRLPKGQKYLENLSAGTIAIPSNQAYGEWSFDWYKGADINALAVIPIIANILVYPNEIASYNITFNATESIVFEKWNLATGGQLSRTSASYFANNTWYRVKVTRTQSGVFTLLIKGGAFTPTAGYDGWTLISTAGAGTNPVTDTSYTTSNYFVLDMDAGDRVTNIKLTDGIKQL